MANAPISRWHNFASMVSSCFRRPRFSKVISINRRPRRTHRYRVFRSLRFKYFRKRARPVEEFCSVLAREGLLAPSSVFSGVSVVPVLNICFGFTNEELLEKKRIVYHSYSTSKWDTVLAPKEKVLLANDVDQNDPIVDGLPASLWLDCIEPTLVALVSLSRLKRRKTNLIKKRSPGPRLRRDFGMMHRGDMDRHFWNAPMIGPPIINLAEINRDIGPQITAEVRPSPLTAEHTPATELDLVTKNFKERKRSMKRSKFTTSSITTTTVTQRSAMSVLKPSH